MFLPSTHLIHLLSPPPPPPTPPPPPPPPPTRNSLLLSLSRISAPTCPPAYQPTCLIGTSPYLLHQYHTTPNHHPPNAHLDPIPPLPSIFGASLPKWPAGSFEPRNTVSCPSATQETSIVSQCIGHVFGQAPKREQCYDNLRISKNAWDTNLLKANPKYLAVNWEAGGGGAFAVIPLEERGKLPEQLPLFRGHTAVVLDTDWSPFHDQIIASASDDGKVFLWQVPEDFTLRTDADEPEDVKPVGKLSGHSRYHLLAPDYGRAMGRIGC